MVCARSGSACKTPLHPALHAAQVFNFERFILGGEIVKWNGNAGFVNFKETADVVHAFTHWTWHVTNGELMVADAQGMWDPDKQQYLLFDPAIHSRSTMSKWRFGRTNLGQKGMQMVFMGHRCNAMCKHLGLRSHPAQMDETIPGAGLDEASGAGATGEDPSVA